MDMIDSAEPMSNRCLDTIMPEGEPVGDIRDPDSLDPISLGFMCGIEIHQQLSSGKLHSRQPSALYEGSEDHIRTLLDQSPRDASVQPEESPVR